MTSGFTITGRCLNVISGMRTIGGVVRTITGVSAIRTMGLGLSILNGSDLGADVDIDVSSVQLVSATMRVVLLMRRLLVCGGRLTVSGRLRCGLLV